MCSTSSLVNKIVGFHDHQTKHCIDYKSNYKKVGVLPIRIVQSNVSSVGPSSKRNNIVYCVFQVTYERESLLKHPLVTFLLRHKWRSYGRYVYYASFAFYMIFLFFLTGYALVTSEKVPPGGCVAPSCNCSTFNGIVAATPFEVFWIHVGKNVVLILAIFVLIIKVC